jgi:hypothetical protein
MKNKKQISWLLPIVLAGAFFSTGVTTRLDPKAGISVFVETVDVKKDGKARFILPRTALRDKSTVWIKTDNGKLAIRKIRVAEYDDITIIIDQGIVDGDKVIISPIPQPYSGMKLHSADDGEKGKKEGMNR